MMMMNDCGNDDDDNGDGFRLRKTLSIYLVYTMFSLICY